VPPDETAPSVFLLAPPPPDSTETGDTIHLIYPFHDNENVIAPEEQSPMFLKEPQSVQTVVEYDPETNQYVIRKKIGDLDYRLPYTMSLDEYLKYDLDRSISNYWSERAKAAGSKATGDGIIPQIYVGGAAFEKIFGFRNVFYFSL
jgi:hypothetical protein